MTEDAMLTEQKGPIMVVTLNRPEVANSLDRPMLMKGAELVHKLHYDTSVRAIIVTGAGEKSFCAGADLKERAGMTMGEVRQYIMKIRDTFTAIENLPQPVICAINGAALGGGLELSLACDLRIAAPHASFALTEVKFGIIPGGGGTQRLPRLIGRGRAKEMILLGRKLSAQEALAIGLVNEVAEEGKLMDAAFAMAQEVCETGPIAVQQAKYSINRGMEVDINTGLQIESKSYEVTIPTKDRIEALEAFKEKRKPNFKGE